MVGLFLMVTGGLISQDVALMAQNMMTTPMKYISKAQIMKGLDESKSGTVAGQSVQIVPNFVVRHRLEGTNNASIHSSATDRLDSKSRIPRGE